MTTYKIQKQLSFPGEDPGTLIRIWRHTLMEVPASGAGMTAILYLRSLSFPGEDPETSLRRPAHPRRVSRALWLLRRAISSSPAFSILSSVFACASLASSATCSTFFSAS